MSTETIVEFTVRITKQDKNLYYYAAGVQPGGSKIETKTTVTPDPGGDPTQDVAVTAAVETNPPVKVGGQALGIGQALQMVAEQVHAVLDNAGAIR
jgi:hypothetical protein